MGGEDAECDPHDWVDIENPDDFKREITPEFWETQVLRLARRIPSLGVPHQKLGVVDCYDVSDDWIPIYDKSDLPGFFMLVGTSGNQYKNATVAAHCVCEMIAANEAGHDTDREPLTVPGRFTGLPLDMATFSRLRTINPQSSMSVNG